MKAITTITEILIKQFVIQIQTGGCGVRWDENLSISDSALYKMGKRVPLTAEDFKVFASERIINAAEAAETWLDRRELDNLIYYHPLDYVDLVLNGDVKAYLDTVSRRQR